MEERCVATRDGLVGRGMVGEEIEKRINGGRIYKKLQARGREEGSGRLVFMLEAKTVLSLDRRRRKVMVTHTLGT